MEGLGQQLREGLIGHRSDNSREQSRQTLLIKPAVEGEWIGWGGAVKTALRGRGKLFFTQKAILRKK